MIQIKRDNLDSIAQNHYENLKGLVNRRLKNKTGPLFTFIKDNITEILIGKPQILVDKIINEIPYNPCCKEEIERIFNYKEFTDQRRTYHAYHLANGLRVNVCPYCNRQYTFTILEKGTNKGQTRPEFDHFFLQSQYPYLALSFYNLIPSCKICNSTFKHDKAWNLSDYIHPYIEGFGNCKFSLKPKQGQGVSFFYGKSDAFDIYFKNKTSKTCNNINDLKLENIYNEHKDYVSEIIQKANVYSDSYINQLFMQYEGTLFSSIGDVRKMVMSNYITDEDIDKRVLSKLSKDISEELGLA